MVKLPPEFPLPAPLRVAGTGRGSPGRCVYGGPAPRPRRALPHPVGTGIITVMEHSIYEWLPANTGTWECGRGRRGRAGSHLRGCSNPAAADERGTIKKKTLIYNIKIIMIT